MSASPQLKARTDDLFHYRGGKTKSKVEHYGWQPLDAPGVPFIANKKDLRVDTTYQRTMISDERVEFVARNFSWLAFGVVVAAERVDRSLWTIDGQHRVMAAMRRSDIVEVPCLVFKSTGIEMEAEAFYRLNCKRGNVTAYDKLRALLACGDQLARDVAELIEREGYRPTARGRAQNTVPCVGAVVEAMKGSRDVLLRVWPLICELHREAGTESAGLAVRLRVFSALLYIARFGTDDITSPEWRARVLRNGLHAIEQAIDRACNLYVQGGARACALGALEQINKGVRQTSRIGLLNTTERQGQDE